MAETKLSVFKKFADLNEAKEVAFILAEKGIEVQLADNSPALDITFSGNTLDNQIELKIPAEDFRKAKDLLFSELDIKIEEIDPDYYLLDFSTEELRDLLLKCDEWGEYDVLLARKILASKGEDTSDARMEEWKMQRLEELAKPEKIPFMWIVIGYLMCFLGGLLGVFIGYLIWHQQKTLPNGQKVYTYREYDRKQGRKMFWLGLAMLSIVTLYKLLIGPLYL
ncbi:hypothetical protein [Croceimicrobium hydrocarbonivorans]|uniref:DUF2007 domain-containing protein n=1 Tax=Croceimicrobium hydrocarbonivorans TaxID=2761580 RepID=A0A7H0VHJ2_9FLAO|nr:hypothetical protein [Croceimicrobium hydrocarbonivorans]QNR25190.1 hypothetical protein H4K34_04945 [Croceimicrobium hydrocarbonivorans]